MDTGQNHFRRDVNMRPLDDVGHLPLTEPLFSNAQLDASDTHSSKVWLRNWPCANTAPSVVASARSRRQKVSRSNWNSTPHRIAGRRQVHRILDGSRHKHSLKDDEIPGEVEADRGLAAKSGFGPPVLRRDGFVKVWAPGRVGGNTSRRRDIAHRGRQDRDADSHDANGAKDLRQCTASERLRPASSRCDSGRFGGPSPIARSTSSARSIGAPPRSRTSLLPLRDVSSFGCRDQAHIQPWRSPT